jgi:adenylate cyclase
MPPLDVSDSEQASAPKPVITVALAATSRLVRTLVSQFLQKLQISFISIDKVSDVFSRVRSEQPKILLMQLDTGGIDIVQTNRLLRSLPETRNTYIVALSTNAEAEEEALNAGADGFLLFPFDEKRLSEILEASRIRRKRILLIDDSKVIHEYIKGILKNEPYDLLHAFSGQTGLDMITSSTPDLIITDVEMPGMTGYQVCSWVKNHETYSRLPVIISSTLGQGFEIDKGFDAGADDYLVKPVDADEFINKLRSVLFNELKKLREHIVVIDDSKVMLSLLCNALESQGFRVSTAMRGDEGLRLSKALKPALVVTDCEMPGMNGRDVARELRRVAEFKHLPIIMLTAREEKVEKAKARKAGVSEFVAKPFTADKMLALVERLIAEARMNREREAMMSYMSDAAIQQASDRAHQGSSQAMTAYSDHAAILFSDVCGFTTMSEKRSAEETIRLLNSYFDDMVGIIKSNSGTIDKFIGDAIMAVFYGKSPEENAFNAAKSGWQMIERLKAINAEKSKIDDHVHIRVGINSGEVIFGDLGSRISRRDFTVIGDNVNTAQRLESQAPKDHVLISDSTYVLVKDRVEIEKSEKLKLKGKETKILCHVLKQISYISTPSAA